MTYKVLYSPTVLSHLRNHVHYLSEQHFSPKTIERWYVPMLERIDRLYEMPRMYPVDQSASVRHGFEVRKLVHKDYIVRYRINDARRVIEVLSFFHGSMWGEGD